MANKRVLCIGKINGNQAEIQFSQGDKVIWINKRLHPLQNPQTGKIITELNHGVMFIRADNGRFHRVRKERLEKLEGDN